MKSQFEIINYFGEWKMETKSTETKVSRGVGLTVLIILLALAALGLGIWGYMISTKLNTTLESQTVLQTQYDDLKKQNETTISDYDTAQTDLEKNKTTLENYKKYLSSTETSLAKAKDAAVKIQGDVDQALKYIDVLSSLIVQKESRVEIQKRIEITNDPTLKEKYDKLSQTGSQADATAFLEYILKTINNLLKN
jgi:hypothetical protein